MGLTEQKGQSAATIDDEPTKVSDPKPSKGIRAARRLAAHAARRSGEDYAVVDGGCHSPAEPRYGILPLASVTPAHRIPLVVRPSGKYTLCVEVSAT